MVIAVFACVLVAVIAHVRQSGHRLLACVLLCQSGHRLLACVCARAVIALCVDSGHRFCVESVPRALACCIFQSQDHFQMLLLLLACWHLSMAKRKTSQLLIAAPELMGLGRFFCITSNNKTSQSQLANGLAIHLSRAPRASQLAMLLSLASCLALVVPSRMTSSSLALLGLLGVC